MDRLCARLERAAQNTEWNIWTGRVLSEIRRADPARTETWPVLASLSGEVPAMRCLVQQIRCCNPVPPERPQEESLFYMLAAFCPDNRVLGYVIDTWRYYLRTRNSRGLLSCARIYSLVSRHDKYPHLNVFYNLMTGDVLREYRLHTAPADQRSALPFLTERDFHLFGKYLPDFRPFGFRERVQAARNRMPEMTTGGALARACCMSESVFRRRFRQEFGIPVSEWLRRQRRERVERMLRDPEIPLREVAERNGFNMPSTFADYCRRNFGAPPRQMREKLGEP